MSSIDASMVGVQVESARTDVGVPDGLAVARRIYDPAGIPLDLADGLAYADHLKHAQHYDSAGWWMLRPKTLRVGTTFEAGPIIAQTKMPIPVRPGMKVSLAGTFRAKSTQTLELDEDGNETGLSIDVAVYGLGTDVDEYGAETDLTVRLWGHSALLQSNNVALNRIERTIPPLPPATIPVGVDRVVVVVSTFANTTGTPISGNWALHRDLLLNILPYAGFFSLPKIGSGSDVLRLFLTPPAGEIPTYPNPNSATGYAFRDRPTIMSVPADAEIVVVAAPGATSLTAVTVRDGTASGPVVATINVPVGGRVVRPVTCATGSLTITASSGSAWIESIRAREFDTEHLTQTRLHRIEWADVLGPVNKIAPALREADLGITTVRFVSDTIADAITPGKSLRVVGRHPGGHTVVATGTIRNRRIVHAFRREAQLEVQVTDDYPVLGAQTCPAVYDQLHEYGNILTQVGAHIVVDDVDYTGPPGPLPAGWDYFPSYYNPNLSLLDALTMTRNTNKAFLFVDRHNRIRLRHTLDDTYALVVSDEPGEGDMSYGRDIEFGSDTDAIVNTIAVTEHLLDRRDYIERTIGTGPPPQQFDQIASRRRSIDYRRESSIRAVGQARRSFDVVRGTGSWEDIRNDRFGPSFEEWAAGILDELAVDRTAPRSLRLIVEGPDDVAKVARLQPLDAILIWRRGTPYSVRIRQLEHTISPDRWFVDLEFGIRPDQTHWAPTPPPIPIPIVDGGTPAATGTETIDGGTPTNIGPDTIDGGTP